LVAVGLVAEERVADRVCMVRVLVGCCLYYHPVLESRFNFIKEPDGSFKTSLLLERIQTCLIRPFWVIFRYLIYPLLFEIIKKQLNTSLLGYISVFDLTPYCLR
jgi:hypothetical protein